MKLLFVLLSAMVAVAMAGCETYETVAACQKRSSTQRCVWVDAKCQVDPCKNHASSQTDCIAANAVAMCMWAPYSSVDYRCINANMQCAFLEKDTCNLYPYCIWRDQMGYCDSFAPKTNEETEKPKAELTCEFPKWSIFLVFMWVFLLFVVIGVVCVLRKSAQQAVGSVKQDVAEVKGVVGSKMDENLL